ncbi:hypothetical protein PHYBLDRAFT_168072 [Phycomyces blakesleeanus NRRL 1555(-)]|uniref:Inclusion body clearance protein IML2 n=1 Tax=Phycomyces blakesleeanus (strain ATCC 8743b / DSM 1359 / FGSC 10004 / NBRC 33097 / NRRL 1555) TaxID=763407 RepID=A0A162XB54_PHYB8|nr:hypothetical protein PHYBLDRAFT_168072 [Phycomyces blakesleeanus NRRL 1555(-)]OAD73635.1 hypothetical protein PHYBLDRAFT_168072 [Phycomyces blakesleeanus NRRL 1555(-)]|eukprot:XP_018291675.1 hypothetical protein PHYBLDRAFT_168072 [Phycomyces blakesleeanus NRRL 1555(-)]
MYTNVLQMCTKKETKKSKSLSACPLFYFILVGLDMFRQLTYITRRTNSSIKHANTTNTATYLYPETIKSNSGQPFDIWLAEAHHGLDAFLDDQINDAQAIFQQSAAESSFHAVGCAFIAYIEAISTLEPEKIQLALYQISSAECLVKQSAKDVHKQSSKPTTVQKGNFVPVYAENGPEEPVCISFSSPGVTPSSSSSTLGDIDDTIAVNNNRLPNPGQSTYSSPFKPDQAASIQHKLLELNCMLMYATLQLLRDNWVGYIKSAYKLRTAYKTYEHLFHLITGLKPREYASRLQKTGETPSDHSNPQSTLSERHCTSCMLSALSDSTDSSLCTKTSMIGAMPCTHPRLPSRSCTLPSLSTTGSVQGNSGFGKRSSVFSLYSFRDVERVRIKNCEGYIDPLFRQSPLSQSSHHYHNHNHNHNHKKTNQAENQDSVDPTQADSMIKSGIFFGIGAFSLIFSLLPPKVSRVLNTLGFHSSRVFAIDVLQQSYETKGLYGDLSGFFVLSYYSSLSFFGHNRLLPHSLKSEDTRNMLDQLKEKHPRGKLWDLLDGRMVRMEGNTEKSVDLLRDARRRNCAWYTAGTPGKNKIDKWYGFDFGLSATDKNMQHGATISDFGQFQMLAIHEMGWGQIFLGNHFQASETFFRLETMNLGSSIFYHYIASCCMFADGSYDKAALEFQQIPSLIEQKRRGGRKVLRKERFSERRIERWIERAQEMEPRSILNGTSLRRAVFLEPLWELIYLWNGFSLLKPAALTALYNCMETCMVRHQKILTLSEIALLYLMLGVVTRELGNYNYAEDCLRKSIALETKLTEDRWVISFSYYESAILYCLRDNIAKDNQTIDGTELIRILHCRSIAPLTEKDSSGSKMSGQEGIDWGTRLHIRWQLLLERLERS